MGHFDYLKDDDKVKHSTSFAENISSNKANQPPAMKLTANDNREQPIQGMFANTQMMGQDIGFPDLNMKPQPSGPTPIPYPQASNVLPSTINIVGGNRQNAYMGMAGNMGHTSTQESGGGLSGIWDTVTGGVKTAVDSISTFGNKVTETASEEAFDPNPAPYLNAIDNGLFHFKMTAGFRNINIMAITAIGAPGCLTGSGFSAGMMISNVTMQGKNKILGNAVSAGIGSLFDSWRSGVTVPGLPWYPAFAAFPAAFAPPMPNIPTPLMSCVSGGMSSLISPAAISNAIKSNLPEDMKTPEVLSTVQIIGALAATKFLHWLSTQMVTNVMGMGPVPSFAPPVIPTGPVIGGSTIPTPGHLIS